MLLLKLAGPSKPLTDWMISANLISFDDTKNDVQHHRELKKRMTVEGYINVRGTGQEASLWLFPDAVLHEDDKFNKIPLEQPSGEPAADLSTDDDDDSDDAQAEKRGRSDSSSSSSSEGAASPLRSSAKEGSGYMATMML